MHIINARSPHMEKYRSIAVLLQLGVMPLPTATVLEVRGGCTLMHVTEMLLS